MFVIIPEFVSPIVQDIPTKWDKYIQQANEKIDHAIVFIWHAFSNHPTEFVTAIATAIIAWFTYILSKSTKRLWQAGERQLIHFERTAERQARETEASIAAARETNEISRRALVASRRAWLTLEDATLVSGSQFLEEGMILKTRVTVKNLGQTPATRAELDFRAHFTTDKTPYPQAVEDFKNKLKQVSMTGFGAQIVFPGDTYTQQLLWSVGKDAMEVRTRETDGAKFIDFMIFIGISYQVAGDSEAHITFFPYDLLNIPVGYTVPTDRTLQPMQLLPGEAS